MGFASFQKRPLTYRVSAILAVVSVLMQVAGVASPYWHQSPGGSSYGGLWSRCGDEDGDSGNCVDRTVQASEDWWVWVQVLSTLALFCASVSCGAIVFENCFTDVNSPFLMQEMSGMVAGLLGLIASILFVVQTQSDAEDIYSTYSWAFYLFIIGAIVIFVASFVILVGGKSVQKSLRLQRADGHVSPEPVRRFSHLWARESPATPESVRRAMKSAQSRDNGGAITSFPPVLKTPQPVYQLEEEEEDEKDDEMIDVGDEV